MYNGFDWYGRILEVREVRLTHGIDILMLIVFVKDRYAGLSGPGGHRGGFRGGLRGFRGGLRGSSYGGRGGYGRGGYAAGGRNFSDQDLYKDYSGPDQQAGGYSGGTYDGGFTGGYSGSFGAAGFESEPSQQIMVRNVSKFRAISDSVADLARRQLPWSTANEDLVELFETTGQVELAEILFDGTRSKGAGVVQFGQVAEAETAIGAFLSPHISFVSEMVGGYSQVPAIRVWGTTA
jgi:hypothetical protein